MYFIDKESEKFFAVILGQVKNADVYTKSLIYLLSSNKETREHFNEIYDIKKNEVNIEILKLPWQTNNSLNVCRLAFNLFGDLCSDNIEDYPSFEYTVSSILKNINIELGIQAIKIRFYGEIVE